MLDELQGVLSKNPGIEKVLVSRRTLHNALTSVLDGEIDPVEPVEWANLVEQHDDEIAYEPGFQQFIATHVFRLSMPEINEPMGKDLCRQMIAELAH